MCNRLVAVYVLFSLSMMISCSSTPSHSLPLKIPNSTELKLKKIDRLSLGVGDVIEVRVYQEEELSGLYRISPQGGFSFPLIGEINAKGLSTTQLSDHIATRLKKGYLRHPHVTIFIKESHSKKIFILGKVKKPGTYRYESGMSVVQAIALAGGLLPLATSDLILIREDPDRPDQEIRYQIPFKEISLGRAQNSLLQPGDILFIPESWL